MAGTWPAAVAVTVQSVEVEVVNPMAVVDWEKLLVAVMVEIAAAVVAMHRQGTRKPLR